MWERSTAELSITVMLPLGRELQQGEKICCVLLQPAFSEQRSSYRRVMASIGSQDKWVLRIPLLGNELARLRILPRGRESNLSMAEV